MILKTEQFKLGLSIFSKIKRDKATPATFFYTDKGSLYAECKIEDSAQVKILMATGVSEKVEFYIILEKLQGILNNYTLDDFELIVRPSNLYIKAGVDATISLHEGTAKFPPVIERTIAPLMEVDFPVSEYKDLITEYLKCTHQGNKDYSYLYLKDKTIAIAGASLRVSKTGIDIPYPIILSKGLVYSIFSLLYGEQETVHIKFFEESYEIGRDYHKIYVPRLKNVEKSFTSNVTTLPVTFSGNTHFTVNKETLQQICDSSKFLIKEANNVIKLHIDQNKIEISTYEDKVDYSYDFKASGAYTNKNINIIRLMGLLSSFEGDIQIHSGIEPNGFLYLENPSENIVITIIK